MWCIDLEKRISHRNAIIITWLDKILQDDGIKCHSDVYYLAAANQDQMPTNKPGKRIVDVQFANWDTEHSSWLALWA